jgi:biopolymer transport protein ExbD
MAGTSASGGGGKKKARIEIIPLIDVIFFLLATFVLFTLSLNKSTGVHVILPQTHAKDPIVQDAHTVSVTEQGTLAWDQEFVNLDDFLRRLQQYHTENPEGKILINGDENASFNAAIYVFDEARKAGFEKVLIETKIRAAGR